jgi:transcription-repair coupling factor (superfamily II helicase)
MLAQAVNRLKGSIDREHGIVPASASAPNISDANILLDLPIPAYLPTDWIPEIALRLQVYRRIGGLSALDDVDAMRAELIDRFGALPAAVEGLLFQIRVKLLAVAANATAVLQRDARIEIRLPYLVELNRDSLARLLGDDVRVTRTAVELRFAATEQWRARLEQVLQTLADNIRQGVGT